MEVGPLRIEQSGTTVRWGPSDRSESEMEAYRHATEEWLEGLPEQITRLREEIRVLVAPFDAFDVVSNLWLANAPLDPDTYKESTAGVTAIAEYVASVCLERDNRAPTSGADRLLDARVLGPLSDKVREVLMLHSLQIHHEILSAPGDDSPAFRELRARLVSHQLYVQGPGFDFQETPLLRDLFGHDATTKALVSSVGFSVDDAIRLADACSAVGLERIQARSARARKFARELTEACDDPGSSSSDTLKDVALRLKEFTKAERKKRIRNLSMAWAFAALGHTTQVTVGDLSNATGIAETTVAAFLSYYSVDFGRMPATRIEADLQALRERPILCDGDGNYLVGSAISLFWALRPGLEAALKDVGGKTWDGFVRHRGALVEKRALEYLEGALPGSRDSSETVLRARGGWRDHAVRGGWRHRVRFGSVRRGREVEFRDGTGSARCAREVANAPEGHRG
jgi:hypothetical protein